MGWWERLPPETRLELLRRYPGWTPNQMALKALEDPVYAKAFARLEYTIFESADQVLMGNPEGEYPCVEVNSLDEVKFGDLLAAALLESVPDREASQIQPALPLGLNSFTHGTIQKAVVLLAGGATRNDVATATGLQPKNATRVRNLRDGGLLPLNKQDKLVPDPRVARVGGKLALAISTIAANAGSTRIAIGLRPPGVVRPRRPDPEPPPAALAAKAHRRSRCRARRGSACSLI